MVKLLLTLFFGIALFSGFSQAPVISPIVGPSVVCAGSSTQNTYSTSATNFPSYYTWSVSWPNAGVVINNANSSSASYIFPNANATYTIYCYATNGSGMSFNQPFVVTIFQTPNVSFSGANTFCQGSSTNLSASSTIQGASTTISYNWAPSSGLNTTTGPNVIASPSNATTYTVTALNGSCSNSSQITVTPFQMLPVTFSGSNTFCQGSSTNLSASSTIQGASQTVFYSWSPSFGLNTTTGANVIASPSVSTNYTVTGYYGACTNSGQITIGPNGFSVPIISASATNTLVCYGDSTILNATGANTYTWSSGLQNGVPFGVYNSNTYYVNGTDVNGCVGSSSVNIIGNPSAIFSINSSYLPIQAGDSSTITINGNAGTTYSLNGVSTPTLIVLTPTVTTTYILTSMSPSGCDYMQYYTQYVGYVMGVQPNELLGNYFNVYPNPNNGVFNLKSSTKETVRIINELGEIIRNIELSPGTELQVTDLSAGIYLIHSDRVKMKIIVTQ